MSESGESSKKRRKTGFRLFNRQRPSIQTQKSSRVRAQPSQPYNLMQSSPLNANSESLVSQIDTRKIDEAASTKSKKTSFQPFGWLFNQRSRRSRSGGARKRGHRKSLRQVPSSSEVLSHNRLTMNGNGRSSLSNQRNESSRFEPRSQEAHSHGNGGNYEPLSRQMPQNRWLRGSDTHLQANNPTFLQQQTVLQPPLLQQEEGYSDVRSRKRRKQKPINLTPRSRSTAIALYAARMLILSIGVGVLAGTVLSAWNPTNSPFAAGLQTIKQASSAPSPQENLVSEVKLAQEMRSLKVSVETLIQQNPKLKPGIFLIDLDNNDYLDLSGTDSFSAASMIKVPILIAFFQALDSGKIRLDEKLVMQKESVAEGSGDLQYLPVGSQFTALDIVTRMITISDNTATNILIARLGGMSALNQQFKSWGLSTTTLNKLLPDLTGTNVSSPKELASLMVRVSQGDLVSLRSRDRMLDIMRRTVNNSQLPQGLGDGATIAHKTGDIGTLVGDIGLIDMPNGKRYATAILVKRNFNDDAAYDLVQKISRISYQHLSNAKAVTFIQLPATSTAPKP